MFFGAAQPVNVPGSGNCTSPSAPSLTTTANLNYEWRGGGNSINIEYYPDPANPVDKPLMGKIPGITTGAPPALTTFNTALWVGWIDLSKPSPGSTSTLALIPSFSHSKARRKTGERGGGAHEGAPRSAPTPSPMQDSLAGLEAQRHGKIPPLRVRDDAHEHVNSGSSIEHIVDWHPDAFLSNYSSG